MVRFASGTVSRSLVRKKCGLDRLYRCSFPFQVRQKLTQVMELPSSENMTHLKGWLEEQYLFGMREAKRLLEADSTPGALRISLADAQLVLAQVVTQDEVDIDAALPAGQTRFPGLVHRAKASSEDADDGAAPGPQQSSFVLEQEIQKEDRGLPRYPTEIRGEKMPKRFLMFPATEKKSLEQRVRERVKNPESTTLPPDAETTNKEWIVLPMPRKFSAEFEPQKMDDLTETVDFTEKYAIPSEEGGVPRTGKRMLVAFYGDSYVPYYVEKIGDFTLAHKLDVEDSENLRPFFYHQQLTVGNKAFLEGGSTNPPSLSECLARSFFGRCAAMLSVAVGEDQLTDLEKAGLELLADDSDETQTENVFPLDARISVVSGMVHKFLFRTQILHWHAEYRKWAMFSFNEKFVQPKGQPRIRFDPADVHPKTGVAFNQNLYLDAASKNPGEEYTVAMVLR